MVTKIALNGHTAYCKTYFARVYWRRFLLLIWNPLVRLLGLSILRAPPALDGAQACALEHRRIEHLRLLGARVPEVLGHGPRMLILSDTGEKLSRVIRRQTSAADIDTIMQQVLSAMVAVHQHKGYVGQPVTRNITIRDEQIHFIDFEEDVLQTLTLEEAQARDYLLFIHTAAHYYADRSDVLVQMLTRTLHQLPATVLTTFRTASARLQWLQKVLTYSGTRGKRIAHAIDIMAKV